MLTTAGDPVRRIGITVTEDPKGFVLVFTWDAGPPPPKDEPNRMASFESKYEGVATWEMVYSMAQIAANTIPKLDIYAKLALQRALGDVRLRRLDAQVCIPDTRIATGQVPVHGTQR